MTKNIEAVIKRVIYTATLCDPLTEYSFDNLEEALDDSAFLLALPNGNKLAISRWVSPKRTRSYPYVRVYDTINFKPRVTIIPFCKDEGRFGDRDFIQWDTISMMSLLGVYVIIGNYEQADVNLRNRKKQKITNQKFDINHIYRKIYEFSSYQSEPLHWNLDQLGNIGDNGKKAIQAYERIGNELGVPMHSSDGARKKIGEIASSYEAFKGISRKLAAIAANREVITTQPKEQTIGEKYSITITNYLGGEYHLTADEVRQKDDTTIQIVEAKHTSNIKKLITSKNDIKDAIFKMILFTNLENIRIDGKQYKHESVVKLTSSSEFDYRNLNNNEKLMYDRLIQESEINRFLVVHK